MTEQHAEAHAEQRPPETLGLEALSESETVLGIRFFVAARADSPEAARNILSEEIRARDKKLRLEGVYNPILQPFSIAERKDYWEKEGSSYDVALEKWHTRFTALVNQVTDQTRIAAFKSILPPEDDTLKAKELKDINKDDALKLFDEYSNNKSDIDKFMGRAIINLTSAGVLEPDALQAHINHLRWIATGFFGKETASRIGTQILLEFERKKDPIVVSEFIDENLDRVNNPSEAEQTILTDVREKAVRFAATPAAQPTQPVVQVPAYDDDDLLPPPIETRGTVRPEPPPPPVEDRTLSPEGQPAPSTNPPSTATTAPERTSTTETETVKGLGKGNNPLMEELNDELRRSTGKDNLTVGVPPRKLMEYMISAFAEGKTVEVGRMEVSRDDKITISRVKISQPGGNVTLNNITISNNPNAPGISATVGKIDKSILAKAFAGNVEQQISTMNDVFLAELKKRINADNDSWAPKSLSIQKGMITVGFRKI